jgi:hypothetical protein
MHAGGDAPDRCIMAAIRLVSRFAILAEVGVVHTGHIALVMPMVVGVVAIQVVIAAATQAVMHLVAIATVDVTKSHLVAVQQPQQRRRLHRACLHQPRSR